MINRANVVIWPEKDGLTDNHISINTISLSNISSSTQQDATTRE